VKAIGGEGIREIGSHPANCPGFPEGLDQNFLSKTAVSPTAGKPDLLNFDHQALILQNGMQGPYMAYPTWLAIEISRYSALCPFLQTKMFMSSVQGKRISAQSVKSGPGRKYDFWN
jgi:hypothetical protein